MSAINPVMTTLRICKDVVREHFTFYALALNLNEGVQRLVMTDHYVTQTS